MPPSLSEVTPMIFNTGLTHVDSEASNSRTNKFTKIILSRNKNSSPIFQIFGLDKFGLIKVKVK